MPRASFAHGFLAATLSAALVASAPTIAVAQSADTAAHGAHAAMSHAAMSRDEIAAFAKVEVAVSVVRDSAQAQLAQARNKTPVAQKEIQDKLNAQIAVILKGAGTTGAEYERKTFVVATDAEARKLFDGLIAAQTGVPTPGKIAGPAQISMPAGAVGMHLGHIMNGFTGTPNGMGLLPVALAEAKTAAQHAALAARNPTSLDAMKLHAGHVINAVDPSVVATGPGLGYGVKKAANGIVSHIELAAKAPGASQNVLTHANHIATAARSTAERVAQVVAVAQQIQAATTAEAAAPLVTQLVSLTSQLSAGVDLNGDGKIGWADGEGGLQQAEMHMTLLLKGEGIQP